MNNKITVLLVSIFEICSQIAIISAHFYPNQYVNNFMAIYEVFLWLAVSFISLISLALLFGEPPEKTSQDIVDGQSKSWIPRRVFSWFVIAYVGIILGNLSLFAAMVSGFVARKIMIAVCEQNLKPKQATGTA